MYDGEVDHEVMVYFYFFEPDLEPIGGLHLFIELFFLADLWFTSMQLTIDDLPTSAMPIRAILMFSSARLDMDMSRSVSIE